MAAMPQQVNQSARAFTHASETQTLQEATGFSDCSFSSLNRIESNLAPPSIAALFTYYFAICRFTGF
jgi:hypothetical protein